MNSSIFLVEFYLPEKILTNQDLKKEYPEWKVEEISQKTGIFSRHICNPDETASDLGVKAAEKLFQNENIKKEEIDTLIYCTQSPDYALPTTACLMQKRLGLSTSVAAFDYNLGCSGYIYGLAMAGSMVDSCVSKNVLLITSETYSKYIQPDDRASRVLFGDGAAATLIKRCKDKMSTGPFVFGTDGNGFEKLIVRKNKLFMDGAGIFMFAMRRVPEAIKQLLKKSKNNLEDIDCFIFHQANKVVLDNIARILLIEEKKIFRCYKNMGNTVSASVPIALKKAEEEKKIKKGDLIMLVGFGVGLSWGACLTRWKND